MKRTQSSAQEGIVESITGIVESIVFRSEETGYTVCSVSLPDKQDTVTVVGTCPAVWVGETLTATGAWARHKQHGFQFQAESITCVAPTSAKGIERYLASGMINGIGKVNAARIVKKFGTDTLEIIEKESARLQEVEGIGTKRRKLIKESWDQQRGMRDIMIFLQGHGIGTAQSARIFRHYGGEAISKIRNDPYRLCRDIWGIGFKTADSIAMSVGIPAESELRARAGLIHILGAMTEEGHCFCPRSELLLQTESILSIPVEILADALNYEIRKGSMVNDNERIFLADIHDAEVGITEKIHLLIDAAASFKPIDIEKAVPWAEGRMGITFALSQRKALESAMSQKVSIITGGPGVGKTTITRALVDVFATRKLKIQLAAPTGRAAKRLSEATGRDAMTIHRLLKFIPATASFEHNSSNLLKGDVFILDEVSMVDVRLMSHFLEALPDNATLILVGDIDQLPSVGPGNVLADLIHSRVIPSTRLETIFRQSGRSGIVINAHRVNEGKSLLEENGDEPGNRLTDFYFINMQDPEQIIQSAIDIITERIPRRFGLDPLRDIQLLMPMRRNQLGTENLNAILQEKLNPAGMETERFGKKYRVGDRVMQIRNNYEKEVFNGDIGNIAGINLEDKALTVDMDGKSVSYNFSELDELVHAYACTIHKAQGSEYPAVVILLTTQHYRLLQRNLLYTAITRGRKLACLIGSRKAANIAIGNNKIRMRRTALEERLKSSQGGGR